MAGFLLWDCSSNPGILPVSKNSSNSSAVLFNKNVSGTSGTSGKSYNVLSSPFIGNKRYSVVCSPFAPLRSISIDCEHKGL